MKIECKLENSDLLFIIDQEDLLKIKPYRWYIDKENYVYASISGKAIRLHRFLLNPDKNLLVDHKDHNPLNNSRSNIRIATHAQNCANQRKVSSVLGKPTASIYKGVVYRAKSKRKYNSFININNKQIFIGSFHTEIAAALMYDVEAKRLYGEFACLNFPDNNIPDFYEPGIDIKERLRFISRGKKIGKSSAYIGVSLIKQSGKYMSYIKAGDKRYNLGNFNSEIEAALAYNNKVLELGLDRKLNQIVV